MFSESGNKIKLLLELTDARLCKELKIAHSNCQLTDAIFNSQLIHTSLSLRSSVAV